MSYRLPTGTVTARIMGGVTRMLNLVGLLIASTGAIMDRREPLAGAAAYAQTSSSNAANAITLAAVSGARWVISGFSVSFTGGAVASSVKIEDVSGTTVFFLDIVSASATLMPVTVIFPQPLMSAAANTAMIVTVAAGGASVVSKLNLLGVWSELAPS